MATEDELLAELERRGWKNPTEAVLAHWPSAVRANFDFRNGARLQWAVRMPAPSVAPITSEDNIKPLPNLKIEYWLEVGTYSGEPAFRMMGRIPGINASEIEVQEPKSR